MYNMPMPERGGDRDLRLTKEKEEEEERKKEENEKGKQKDYVYSSEKRYISYFQRSTPCPSVSCSFEPLSGILSEPKPYGTQKERRKENARALPEPKLSRSIQDLKFE